MGRFLWPLISQNNSDRRSLRLAPITSPSVLGVILVALAFLGILLDTFGVETLLTEDIEKAAEIIRGGGVVAFPTETVYGLGANAFDAEAVAKIFTAKGRPADNPLIVHVSDLGQIAKIATDLNSFARLFIETFFPGPLTIVAKGTGRVAELATCGLETIAFRMPANPLAQELIKAAGTPLVAPSANISGRPSPTTWSAVAEDLSGKIDCILKGEPTMIGLESTVVDCSAEVPRLLRPGAISIEELRAVVPETVSVSIGNDEPRSPGLRHRHYSPKAKVIVVKDPSEIPAFSDAAYIGIDAPPSRLKLLRDCNSAEEYASSVFEFFRECDRIGIKLIYCQSVNDAGIGAALMDRLRRAAE